MTLEDEIDISRGDMLVKANNPPEASQNVEAMVCWFSQKPDGAPWKIPTPPHHEGDKSHRAGAALSGGHRDPSQKEGASALAMNDMAASRSARRPRFSTIPTAATAYRVVYPDRSRHARDRRSGYDRLIQRYSEIKRRGHGTHEEERFTIRPISRQLFYEQLAFLQQGSSFRGVRIRKPLYRPRV
jgi:hypothetical protein